MLFVLQVYQNKYQIFSGENLRSVSMSSSALPHASRGVFYAYRWLAWVASICRVHSIEEVRLYLIGENEVGKNDPGRVEPESFPVNTVEAPDFDQGGVE